MQPQSDNNIAQLSIGAWIDQVADRFDAAWKSSSQQSTGEPPQIADFLGELSGPSRLQLVRELVAIDREYRSKRGLPRSWEEYVSEFPELASEPATDSETIESTKAMVREVPVAAPSPAVPAADQPEAPQSPAQIGKYKVLRKLGGGGQACAYLVFDPDLSKSVVLKLSHDPADEPELDALRIEGRVLADLAHPHLVRVLHYDVFDGRPFLVMEHVAGQNLGQWAAAARPSPQAAARLVAAIASALAMAHKRGVVHRDLKPANVLIDEAGQPRVIDFGLAWHRHGWAETDDSDSVIAGTVAYMAPEQARAETDRVGQRSDIFGIGAILYYLLTGQAPFMERGERDFQQVLGRARKCSYDAGLLDRKGTPPRLAQICLKAMAAEPDDRYATGDELARDLLEFAAGGRASRRALIAGGLSSAAALAVGAFFFLRQPPLPVVTSPLMTVRVWRAGRGSDEPLPDFAGAAPLLIGRDELQVRWSLPAPLVGDLYVVGPDGTLRLLKAGSSSAGADEMWPGAGQRSGVQGDAGTEMLLLAVRRASSREPQIEWDSTAPWPALPESLVLRFTPEGYEVLQTGRAVPFGPARSFDDPEQVVRGRLGKFGETLKPHYHYFEALVFSVREP
jgi:predicted Ser/Thr protein kinase